MRDACADSETGLTEVNGEPSHAHLLVSFPPKVACPGWSTASRVCRPAGCGTSSQPWPGITGGRTGYGPGPTSPGPPAAPPD
jgi:hypothetical protein